LPPPGAAAISVPDMMSSSAVVAAGLEQREGSAFGLEAGSADVCLAG